MNHPTYFNQALQNRSFRGLDLTGVDFSGADLRGCDFTAATLVGANFERARLGLSHRQVKCAIAVAVIAPGLLVGLSLLLVQMPSRLWGDRGDQMLNVLISWLPLLVLVLEIVFRDSIARNFPKTNNFLGIAAVSALFQVMVILTLMFVVFSVSGVGDGSGVQSLFLLVMAGIAAIVTHRTFQWVRQSIFSNCGTSFRKANLTDANFSQTTIQNTDFSWAVLTGACISGWQIQPHNQFTNITCDYLYLEPAYQMRYPSEGKFHQRDSDAFFSTLIT